MLLKSSLKAGLEQKLALRREKHLLRRLTRIPSHHIDFSSNDYLGFSRDPKLRSKIIAAWEETGPPFLGSTGSRLLTGNSELAEKIEYTLAHHHGAESGLLFHSGYLANLGILSALVKETDCILYDSHIHASMHDGMQLSKAHCFPWRHNSLEHLEKRLKTSHKHGNAFVLIESIYSCDGSQAPLKEILILCKKYEAALIVDEAHATGIVGPNGKGLVDEKGCRQEILASIHTFSKALGTYGAIMLCSHWLKEYLINFCRPLIYSTFLPTPILLTIEESYRQMLQADHQRETLNHLIAFFLQKVREFHLPALVSTTPIQSILISGNAQVLKIAEQLEGNNFSVGALRSPTVQHGKERLRICLHAFNNKSEIENLLNLVSMESKNIRNSF